LAIGLLPLVVLPAFSLPPGISPGAAERPAGEFRREILDPCLGSRWQLVTDPAHPEWPGRLVLVEPPVSLPSAPAAPSGALRAVALPAAIPASFQPLSLAPSPTSPPAPFAIRAGDRLTVDQQTSVLHARLQAIALESARAGQTTRVRLAAGTHSARGWDGTVIAVVVTAPGQASWLASEGGRP
jgi:hypothetical protein